MAITPKLSVSLPRAFVKRSENRALSNLIDQTLAREERAALLAAHYEEQAAKHRAVRRALETLIP